VAASGCANFGRFDGQDPALLKLSTAALETKVRGQRWVAPSQIEQMLKQKKNLTAQLDPAERDCEYRAELLGIVIGSELMPASTPMFWGPARETGALESMFMTMPLRNAWTPEQRRKVLDEFEVKQMAPMLKYSPQSDRDYWRRFFLGLLLACELEPKKRAEVGLDAPGQQECRKVPKV
jgi:hypothetical protein